MKIVVAVLISLSFLLFPVFVLADTGTYRITEYTVILDPQSDGSVDIDYSQTWLVTGGGIPWITIGLANRNFSLLGFNGDVSKVSDGSYGSWSGERLDLYRNYKSGESFKVGLQIKQRNLLEKIPAQKKWRISFTPGWYDNCKIDKLTVVLNSHSDNLSYVFSPLPTTINEFNQVVWEKENLRNGERFTVNIESTDGNFMGTVEDLKTELSSAVSAPVVPKKANSDDGIMWFLLAVFGGVLLIAIVGAFKVYGKYRAVEEEREKIRERAPNKTEEEIDELIVQRRKKKEKEEEESRHIFIPYVPPVINVGSHSPHAGGGRSGGGGASGGWSDSSHSSCVSSCACVSCACACACACAGGGAAGCTNKFNIKEKRYERC